MRCTDARHLMTVPHAVANVATMASYGKSEKMTRCYLIFANSELAKSKHHPYLELLPTTCKHMSYLQGVGKSGDMCIIPTFSSKELNSRELKADMMDMSLTHH